MICRVINTLFNTLILNNKRLSNIKQFMLNCVIKMYDYIRNLYYTNYKNSKKFIKVRFIDKTIVCLNKIKEYLKKYIKCCEK